MYLVKSLGKKYRKAAMKSGAVRVGTTSYYRAIEDEARVDASEGLGEIVWRGSELTAEQHNKIFSPDGDVKLRDGLCIVNKGVPLIGSKPNFNVFVFCYSQVDGASDIAATSKGKATSYYFINNLSLFIHIMKVGVETEIRRFLSDSNPEEANEILRNLDVRDVTYRINYTDKAKSREVDEANIEEFEPRLFHSQDLFTKPSSYSYEQEVRTAFVPIYTGGEKLLPLPIPAEVQYVDLALGPLPISGLPTYNTMDIKTSPLKEPRR